MNPFLDVYVIRMAETTNNHGISPTPYYFRGEQNSIPSPTEYYFVVLIGFISEQLSTLLTPNSTICLKSDDGVVLHHYSSPFLILISSARLGCCQVI